MGLRIARIYYPVLTLGPGQRVGIWTAGCGRRCPGCISPELQDEGNGREMSVKEILSLIRRIPKTPDGFTISGGEPFEAPGDLCALLAELKTIRDDIIIYTGYTLEELRSMDDPDVNGALGHCSLLVDGPYVEEENDGTGLRGSANQHFVAFKHPKRYREMASQTRRLQTIRYGDAFLTIGIPK